MRCGPELVDELTFPTRPPWHRMGLRRVTAGEWLPAPAGAGPVLRAKQRLLEWVPERVVVVGSADPETLDRVAAVLEPHREPTATVGTTTLSRFAPNQRFVEAAAGLVDDVCVMERRDGAHALVAGAVWFPSRWDVRARMGRSAQAIHERVPDDGSRMSARAEQFMARIDPGDTWARTNWFVHDRPVRWAPRPPRRPRDLAGLDPPRLWLRSEHQTLHALDRDLMIFTIRTRLAPISAFAARPEAAAALAAHLRALPHDLVAEKVHPDHVGLLLDYLTRCSSSNSRDQRWSMGWKASFGP